MHTTIPSLRDLEISHSDWVSVKMWSRTESFGKCCISADSMLAKQTWRPEFGSPTPHKPGISSWGWGEAEAKETKVKVILARVRLRLTWATIYHPERKKPKHTAQPHQIPPYITKYTPARDWSGMRASEASYLGNWGRKITSSRPAWAI